MSKPKKPNFNKEQSPLIQATKNLDYEGIWTEEQVAQYKLDGSIPQKTSNGVWVTDISRDDRALSKWTGAELLALHNGEITSRYSPTSTDFYRAIAFYANEAKLDPEQWTDEDLVLWLKDRTLPAVTPRGNYVNNPSRYEKDVDTWSVSELRDFAEGFFKEFDPEAHGYILTYALEIFGYPIGTTYAELHAIALANNWDKGPELTTAGILVNDRYRDAKPVEEWTAQELDAVVNGEIEAPDSILPALIKHLGKPEWWSVQNMVDFISDGVEPEEPPKLADPDPEPDMVDDIPPETPAEEEIDLVKEGDDEDPDDDLFAEDEESDDAEPVEEEPQPEPEPVAEVVEVEPTQVAMDQWSLDQMLAEYDRGTLESPFLKEVKSRWDLEGTTTKADILALDLTPSGVLKKDSRRTNKSAKDFTYSELKAWCLGEIGHTNLTTDKTLLAALHRRFTDLPATATLADIKAHVGAGKAFEYGLLGLLVRDRERDLMPVAQWDALTLRAWARNEVETPHLASDVITTIRSRNGFGSDVSDAQVIEFLSTGAQPQVAVADFNTLEAARPDQLKKALLQGHPTFTKGEIIAYLRKLKKSEFDWTDEAVEAFYLNGTTPERLANGTLIHNRNRSPVDPSGWTLDEYAALLKGELTADFAPLGDKALGVMRIKAKIWMGDYIDRWRDEDIVAYLRDGTKPEKTNSGTYKYDRLRNMQSAGEWSRSLIVEYLTKQIPEGDMASREDIIEQVYIKWNVPACWYESDAIAFALHGTLVPQLPSGIYVRDRERDHRAAHQWTKQEIKAWARGKITSSAIGGEEAMATYAKMAFHLPASLSIIHTRDRIANQTEGSTSMTVSFVTQDLGAYIEGMGKIKVHTTTETQAAVFQQMLARCIFRVLELPGADFTDGWTKLMTTVNENRHGVFKDSRAFHGFNEIKLSDARRKLFYHLYSILLMTSDAATREQNKRLINWDLALKHLPNEEARQRLLAYYR